jgi:DNA-binding transcriptional ArsR family regulator
MQHGSAPVAAARGRDAAEVPAAAQRRAPAEAARLFAALGDPTRLALAMAVGEGARSIRDLARDLPVSRQGVTKHLHVLQAAGLLSAERRGREVLWRGRPEALAAAQAALDRIGAEWDAVLARLKAHVEAGG